MRASWLIAGWCLAFPVNCGGDDPDPKECAARSGIYAFEYTERDGDCGPLPNETIDGAGDRRSIPPDCTEGYIRYSPDNCRVESNWRCPEPTLGQGYYTDTAINTDWDEAGRNGSASMRRLLKDPQARLICGSTYDVRITKL
jgi:hypothetical protein